MSLLILRAFFILVLAAAGWFLRPFDLSNIYAAATGLVIGLAIVFFEFQVRKITLKRLIGAAFGSLLGIIGAYLISLVLARAFPTNSTTLSFLQVLLLFGWPTSVWWSAPARAKCSTWALWGAFRRRANRRPIV